MSAILSVDDLNDFITPGVACIKPVETLPPANGPPTPPSTTDGSEFEVIRDGTPAALAGGATAGGPAQISLTDCLACSGCVTSAEAVLVSLQSHAEVLRTLDAAPGIRVDVADSQSPSPHFSITGLEPPPESTPLDVTSATNSASTPLLYVASVAPQTRANLAAACGNGVTARQAGYMLDHLLAGPAGLRAGGAHGNGFTWVVDTNAAREATLVLGADEVLGRHAQGKTGGEDLTSAASAAPPKSRPLLTSSCPGWVCYAEKTHPHLLGHLSHVKSPQALTGTLLKTTLSKTLGVAPDRIWHVAVMPCFDKKLEASREELTNAAWASKEKSNCDGTCGKHKHDDEGKERADHQHEGAEGAEAKETKKGGCSDNHAPKVRDVDCVITSKEILMLCASRGIDFFSLPKTPLFMATGDTTATEKNATIPRIPFPDPALDKFLFPEITNRGPPTPAAGTSGGNLYFILQSVLAQHPGSVLHTTRGRNVDVVEYSVTAGPNANAPVLFKAARYYGFRNIQNLVRRLKPARPSRLPGGRMAAGGAGGATRRPVGKGGKVAAKVASGAGAGLDFAYVEVMACPGGCTNGGGQVKADDPLVLERQGQTLGLVTASANGVSVGKLGPQEQKQWLAQIDEAYFSADESDRESTDGDAMELDAVTPPESLVDGINPAYVQATLAHWAELTGFDLQQLAYTSFREVVSDIGKGGANGNGSSSNSGEITTERVVQLAGRVGGGW